MSILYIVKQYLTRIKNAVNGVAGLDGDGKLSSAVIPDNITTDSVVTANFGGNNPTTGVGILASDSGLLYVDFTDDTIAAPQLRADSIDLQDQGLSSISLYVPISTPYTSFYLDPQNNSALMQDLNVVAVAIGTSGLLTENGTNVQLSTSDSLYINAEGYVELASYGSFYAEAYSTFSISADTFNVNASADIALIATTNYNLTAVHTNITSHNILLNTGGFGAAVYVTNDGTITLGSTGSSWVYVYTGTSGTPSWSIPQSDNANYPGRMFKVKNRGSVSLTLTCTAPDQIYDTAAVNSVTVAAGASVTLVWDGTYWSKFN